MLKLINYIYLSSSFSLLTGNSAHLRRRPCLSFSCLTAYGEIHEVVLRTLRTVLARKFIYTQDCQEQTDLFLHIVLRVNWRTNLSGGIYCERTFCHKKICLPLACSSISQISSVRKFKHSEISSTAIAYSSPVSRYRVLKGFYYKI